MTDWIAVAYGAIDLRQQPESGYEAELVLLPTIPSDPIGLKGSPAALWRRLVEGPTPEANLDEEERNLLYEFAEFGIASQDVSHPAAVTSLEPPLLSSLFHEMVYSLVGSLARDLGISAVFIKGPILHFQKLRDREHSGDVDVWVSPSQISRLELALEPWGWTSASDQWSGLSFNHSETLVPGSWGCEVDVHRHIPGCAESDDRVFSILQTQSSSATFAGVEVLVPSRAAHAVILALHALRPETRHRKTPSEVDDVAKTLASAGPEVLTFSHEIRAAAVLEAPLALAFPDSAPVPEYDVPLNWRWRKEERWWSAYWMIFRSLTWPERGLFIRRALWPPADVLAASEARAGHEKLKPIPARLRRLKKLFRR